MAMGEKIQNMRKARGWSQEELAERVGVSRQAVSRWESDAAKPDADKIVSICDLFGVSADYLLRDMMQSAAPEITPQLQKKTQDKVSLSQIAGIALLCQSVILLFVFALVGAAQGGTHSIIYGDGTIKNYTGFMAFVTVNRLQWMLYLLAGLGILGLLLVLWKPLSEKLQVIYNKSKG